MPAADDPLVVIGVTLSTGDSTAQVLVVQRRRGEGELSWQFPGGEVENGESEQVAVERETREECGIVAKAVERLGERVHPATGRRIAYWRLDYLSGTLVLGDLGDLQKVQWVPASDVADLFTTDLYPPIAEALAKCHGSNS